MQEQDKTVESVPVLLFIIDDGLIDGRAVHILPAQFRIGIVCIAACRVRQINRDDGLARCRSSRLILLLAMMLLFQQGMYGQRFSSHIGIKGGINISNLSASNQNTLDARYNDRLGADIEVFIETKITHILTVESTALEFSSQGAKKNGFQPFSATDKYASYFPAGQLPPYLYTDMKTARMLNYLLLPTIFKVHTNEDKKSFIKPYISAGFYIGYLLSATEIMSGSGIVYKDGQRTQPLTAGVEAFNQKRNVKTELHKFNAGVSSSIGLFAKIHKTRVYIEGGGNHGFININRQSIHGKNYIRSSSGRIGLSYDVGHILLPFKFPYY